MNKDALFAAASVLCRSLPRSHMLGKRKVPCRHCELLTGQILEAYTDALAEQVEEAS